MATLRNESAPNWEYDLNVMGDSHSKRVLRGLAVELALKSLYEGDIQRKAPALHNLIKLYSRLSSAMRHRLKCQYGATTWEKFYGSDIRPSSEVVTADVPIEDLLTEFADYFTQARYSSEQRYREKQTGTSSPNEDSLDLIVKAAWGICVQEGWHTDPAFQF